MQMETVTTGTAVRYFVMAATPSRLYVFQGTTSLEVNSCLPLGSYVPIVFSVSLLVCSLQVGQGILQHKAYGQHI
jgi:hypothetical protein